MSNGEQNEEALVPPADEQTIGDPSPNEVELAKTQLSQPMNTQEDPTEDSGMGDTSADFTGADTQIASPSQQMAAVTPFGNGGMTVNNPDRDELIGSTLAGRYDVSQQIGQGGMGAVYKGKHRLIGKQVAIKVLLRKYAEDPQVVARLEQEARLASSIGHEHIVDITDFGQTNDGRTFVVMEYMEGESLGERLDREGKLEFSDAIHIGQQIASALGAAHKKGVIHRDVKPENVFLLSRKKKDFVKVLDFGISKAQPQSGSGESSPRLTQTGMVLGTPLYMSPEQARGEEELDHRIDIYALGVILYEMVTGETPFQGKNYFNILSQLISSEIPSPKEKRSDISAGFESIILHALDKDPVNRYATMEQVEKDLAALARSEAPIVAMRKRKSNYQLWVALIVGTFTAIIGGWLLLGGGSTENKKLEVPHKKASVVENTNEQKKTPPPKVKESSETPPSTKKAKVKVYEIKSMPKGAILFKGAVRLGPTPQAVKLVEKVEYTLKLRGYKDSVFTVDPLTSDSPMQVTLGKKETKVRWNVKKSQGKKLKKKKKEPEKKKSVGKELLDNPY